MRIAAIATLALASLCLSACASTEKEARYLAGKYRAQADLYRADGTRGGTAVAEEVDGDIRLIVEVTGVSKGPHGTHIHTTGKCEAPAFTSAGGHWNPTGHQHGRENPAGAHAGDLPNISVDEDGRGRTIFTVKATTLANMLDEDGAALVVHAGPDDYKTDPAGDSGGRILCGVFKAA